MFRSTMGLALKMGRMQLKIHRLLFKTRHVNCSQENMKYHKGDLHNWNVSKLIQRETVPGKGHLLRNERKKNLPFFVLSLFVHTIIIKLV